MYCMPEEGTDLTPKDALLTTAEILRLVSCLPLDILMILCHCNCTHTVMLLAFKDCAALY